MKKKLFSLLLIIIFLFSLASCNDASTEPPTDTPPASTPSIPSTEIDKNRKYSLADSETGKKVKTLGRCFATEKGIACDFTASGIEFIARIEDSFTFTVTVEGADDAYFTVYIDGERMYERYEAKANSTTEIMVDGVGILAEYTVMILKQTESSRSISTISSIEFYGHLIDAAPKRQKYVEFIGDSITCGMGNYWIDKTDGKQDHAVNEDGTKTFATFTAEYFNADFSMISYSGIGVAYGYTGDFTMSDFYQKESYHRNPDKAYDFSGKRVPDLVIINLGTNDRSFEDQVSEDIFKEKAEALIRQIRESYNKNVSILWVGGMMGESRLSWVSDVMTEMGGESSGLYTCSLYSDSHTGAYSHPTIAEQEAGSFVLIDYINNKNLL